MRFTYRDEFLAWYEHQLMQETLVYTFPEHSDQWDAISTQDNTGSKIHLLSGMFAHESLEVCSGFGRELFFEIIDDDGSCASRIDFSHYIVTVYYYAY